MSGVQDFARNIAGAVSSGLSGLFPTDYSRNLQDASDVAARLKAISDSNKNPGTGNPSSLYGWGGGGGTNPGVVAEQMKSLTADALKDADLKTGSLFSNIQQAREASQNLLRQSAQDSVAKLTDDWFKQKQAEQAALAQVRTGMGNGAYSSDLWELTNIYKRVDDRSDAATLQALKEAMQNIENARFNNENETWLSWANQRADFGAALREIAREGATNVANISSDAAKSYFNGNTYDASKNTQLNNLLAKLRPGGAYWLDAPTLSTIPYFRPDDGGAEGNTNAQNRNNSTGQGSSGSKAYWNNRYAGYDGRPA